MLKAAIQLILILVIGTTLYAQTTGEQMDIIHLKNGKVVHGIVLKQEFGTISVKTTDPVTRQDKVQIFQQSEISKIEQKSQQSTAKGDSTQVYAENKVNNLQHVPKQASSGQSQISDRSPNLLMPDMQQQTTLNNITVTSTPQPVMSNQPVTIDGRRSSNPDDYFDAYSPLIPKRRPRVWNRDIRGYRGFVDQGYVQGIGSSVNTRYEFGTSHGFQFNPIFYVGTGAAAYLSLNKKDSSLPIFINPRVNFIDENTTPYLDVKVGYSFFEGKGFYFSASPGMSFSKNNKRSFNLGFSYILQNVKFFEQSKTKPTERVQSRVQYHGIGLRLSFEF